MSIVTLASPPCAHYKRGLLYVHTLCKESILRHIVNNIVPERILNVYYVHTPGPG